MGSATFKKSSRKNVYREKTEIPPWAYYPEETESSEFDFDILDDESILPFLHMLFF